MLGEDKHLWGSQLLNNSERDSQHSVQRRSTVRSAHSLQRRGSKDCTERGRVDKDSMREEDITVGEFLPVCACICTFVCVCVCECQLRMCILCVRVCVGDENRQNEGETGRFLLELSGFS